MNYNTFLTRDYKSLSEPPSGKKPPRWSRLHTILVVVTIIVVTTLFMFISDDAEATRAEPQSLPQSQSKSQPRLLLDPPSGNQSSDSPEVQPELPEQITIPLNFRLPGKSQVQNNISSEPETSWLKVKVKSGDNLAAIFQRHQLSKQELHEIMRLGGKTTRLKSLRPGQTFHFLVSDDQQLQTLIYDMTPLKSLQVSRTQNSFVAKIVQRELDKRLTHTSATINSSLFEAGQEAGMSASLIMSMVSIFGWDIDFALDIRRGDSFSLLYEEQYLDGRKVNNGPVLAAEFINQGRRYRAVRYTDASGHSDYYTEEGYSMRKAFLRTPVDFRRISSRFGKRRHPVLNRMRLHKGVDYAARRGTPIKASGDGKVIFKGRKGGYGRTVIIQHGGRYNTLYAHMSRFNRKVRNGRRVKQGQIIGYVGSSGRATGPHLHYEFRVNGVHRNPLTVKLPNASPISAKYKQQFLATAEQLLTQLDVTKPTVVALNQ